MSRKLLLNASSRGILPSMVTPEIELQLRMKAGDGAYERGLAYFDSGKVDNLSIQGTKTTAQVEGTYMYCVTLHRTSRGFDGVCDCPASDGFDFCKHCVAVALTLVARDEELATLKEGSAEDKIRAYLMQQDKETLVDSLLEAANKLPDMYQRLSLHAAATQGQVNLNSLKKEITAASPLRDIWRRQEVRRYFARFETVLKSIVEIADNLPAKDLLKLVTHSADRLNKALERVDDSDGNRWVVQLEINALNIKAMSGMDWTTDQQASHLLDGVLADPYDLFAGYENAYHELLGESGWQSFYTKARNRLEELPSLDIGAGFEEAEMHMRLRHLLKPWYEARGEIGELISVMQLTCCSTTDCHNIAALYLSQGDLKHCAEWLAKGDALLQRPPQATKLHVAYYEASGNLGHAVEAQQSMFFHRSSYASLNTLLRLADLASVYNQTKRTALAHLEKQLEGHVFQAETAAMILARYHHDQGNLDTAFELLRSYVNDEDWLLDVISWFEDQPDRACILVQIAIEDCISKKKKRAYRRTAQLLEQVAKPWFERLGGDAFETFLATLRDNHKAKRSLISVLDEKGLSPV